MYLEETIEALEVQEDSGLSNDEPDPLLRAEKMSMFMRYSVYLCVYLCTFTTEITSITGILTAVIVLFFLRHFQFQV